MGKGGGTSGTVAYPAHMTSVHTDWLNKGVDLITASVTDVMNTATAGVSPYAAFVTVDPAVVFGVAFQVLNAFQAVEDIDALNLDTIFTNAVAAMNDNVEITAMVAAQNAMLTNRLTTEILPIYQSGMRDMGAVHTSSFTLGEANIQAEITRNIADYDAKLRLESRRNAVQLAIEWTKVVVQWNISCWSSALETAIRYSEARMKVDQLDMEFAGKDRLFALETFQYGSNVMASIAGAAAGKVSETSGIATTLGNMASMASMGLLTGAMVPGAGPTTALIGAGIGAGVGLLSSIF